MVLTYQTLVARFNEFIHTHKNENYINPASIDVCIGNTIEHEILGRSKFESLDISDRTKENPYILEPGHFILAATLEVIAVPTDLSLELKLKSSRAREGYNHSLAFWVDPGWFGILTMEISNVTRYQKLPIYPGLRFGQLIYHQLDQVCEKPYTGNYNNATSVQRSYHT